MKQAGQEHPDIGPYTGQLKSAIKRLAAPAAIAVVFAAAWLAGLFDALTLSRLIMEREALSAFADRHLVTALALYVALYAVLVAISFPGASLLTIAAGFVFGGIVAGLATVVAATAGSVAIFLIARSSFGDLLANRAGPFVARMVDGFNRDAFSYLLVLRLTPLFPFWAVNIVPALLNMRLTPYALATFLGIIPGTFAYSYVGAGLNSVIAAQEAANPGCAASETCRIDPSELLTPEIFWAMCALAAISIIPVLARRYFARQPD